MHDREQAEQRTQRSGSQDRRQNPGLHVDRLHEQHQVDAVQRAGSNAYTYDAAGRLTSWTSGLPDDIATVEYAWDAAGNRIRAGDTTAVFDARNRLLSEGDTHYTHTARGTVATVTSPEDPAEETRDLAFDAFERKITDGDTTFRYDALDRVTHHGDTRFTYDGGSNNLLLDGASYYTRTPGGSLIDATDLETGTTQWLITDQHSDVVAELAEGGTALAGSRSYDPFGQPLAAEGSNPAVGYQSGWTDPDSGDVNMAARWYQPGTGSFSSRDTMLLNPSPSVQANRYSYANAAPLSSRCRTDHGGCRSNEHS
jgi:RHS repeat-associated protein